MPTAGVVGVPDETSPTLLELGAPFRQYKHPGAKQAHFLLSHP